jgi:hypothetical protein
MMHCNTVPCAGAARGKALRMRAIGTPARGECLRGDRMERFVALRAASGGRAREARPEPASRLAQPTG